MRNYEDTGSERQVSSENRFKIADSRFQIAE
jgi:hypothetical protein